MTKEKKAKVPKTDMGNVSLKLSIKDRLVIRNLYPEKSSLTNQIIARDIERKIELSQKEIKAVEMTTLPSGGVQWNENKDKGKDVKFTEAEINIIREWINDADKNEQISVNMVDLAQMIKNL